METGFLHPWRPQQAAALAAFADSHAKSDHNHYLIMPPGAGKTHVGLEIARRVGRKTIILCPNTAIQSQWLAAWDDFSPAAVTATADRRLPTQVTVLTYQSVAVFDPDAEVDEEGRRARAARSPRALLDRLHENGRALVERIRADGPCTLVLDECHHLLETWGHLLLEVVAFVSAGEAGRVIVVGLTATPASRLTAAERELVETLFGDITYATSAPAVVKTGHIAPYQELVMLTEPTLAERDYIHAEAERFTELVTDLLDPHFGTTPFLAWCSGRFVRRTTHGSTVGVDWDDLDRQQPELAAAAIRLSVAGLLDLPAGSRIREQHRRHLDANDWALLIGDWIRWCLSRSTDRRDLDAIERLRNALPAVGYQVTRAGVRTARSPVDRVLARSAAKAIAAVEVLRTEESALGNRMRAIIVCDHERATAQLSARLRGVLSADAGSARLVLETLVGDSAARDLDPILVTGRTVACALATAQRLTTWLRAEDPNLELEDPDIGAATGWTDVVDVIGRWGPRRWLPLVTRFFEDGGCKVLVGTRGLLGEGWDAKRVNVVIDLTTATTSTSVIQLRGRGLRLDAQWPTKVANTWTVVTVADGHPKGTSDYSRFVAKHDGFFGVDDDGQITSGVSHVDPALSPYAPPKPSDFDVINRRMSERARGRDRARSLWGIGEPYADVASQVVQVRNGRPFGLTGPALDAVLPPRRTVRRGSRIPLWVSGLAGVPAWLGADLVAAPRAVVVAGSAVMGYAIARSVVSATAVVRCAGSAGLHDIAATVADALHHAGLVSAGAEAVGLTLTARADGSYLATVRGATDTESGLFATALDEVLSPLANPRYVVSRRVLDEPRSRWDALRLGMRRGVGLGTAGAEVWHAVPAALAGKRQSAEIFHAAWRRRVSPGRLVYAHSPEGEGILSAQRGEDPFAVTTAMRTVWR